MKNFKKILVISHSSKDCPNVLATGVSLAKEYGAQLYLMHVIHDPFNADGWNLPIPYLEQEYQKLMERTRKELDKKVQAEKATGLDIIEIIKEGEPDKVIIDVVQEEKIDLIIMLAHEEGRLEHFLFGKTNDRLIRKIPASIMLCKC